MNFGNVNNTEFQRELALYCNLILIAILFDRFRF